MEAFYQTVPGRKYCILSERFSGIYKVYEERFPGYPCGRCSRIYRNLEKKTEEKALAPSTCAKKIRELNSLANYIYENRLEFGVDDDYTNHFADYVKKVQKVSMYANAVPVEDIDRLLVAAQENHMVYCIVICFTVWVFLLQRSST